MAQTQNVDSSSVSLSTIKRENFPLSGDYRQDAMATYGRMLVQTETFKALAHACRICGTFISASAELRDVLSQAREESFVCVNCADISQLSNLRTELETRNSQCLFPFRVGDNFHSSATLEGEEYTESQTVGRPPGDENAKSSIQPSVSRIDQRFCMNRISQVCELCGQSFSDSSTMRRHLRSHSGVPAYSCNTSGKSLSDHLLNCSLYCPYSCDRSDNLPAHVDYRTRTTPFVCDTCGKSFRDRTSLQRHVPSHTGERPHSCQYCGKAFVQKANLMVHIRTHTGERPYSCETCGKSFAQSSTLRKHARCHTEERSYVCDTCGKLFADSNDLRRHAIIHTGERPYSCEICERAFVQKWNLIAHIRTHTGERPYLCETCGKSFAQSSTLRRHTRSHT